MSEGGKIVVIDIGGLEWDHVHKMFAAGQGSQCFLVYFLLALSWSRPSDQMSTPPMAVVMLLHSLLTTIIKLASNVLSLSLSHRLLLAPPTVQFFHIVASSFSEQHYILCFVLPSILLIDDLLKQLTVLDELQLSLKFCRCLHNECFALKNKVFAPLLLSGGKRSKISILFMTATATRTIFQQTTLLTGLTFCQWNVFWPGPSHMLYRGDAKYNLSWLHNHLAYLTSNVDKLYNKAMEGDAIQHQFVVFANSPTKVEVFPGAEKSILIWNSIHWQCHHHGHQHSIQDAKDEELYCLILARGSWLLLPCWQWNLWCHCLLSYSYDWRHWLGLLPHSQWGAVRPSNRYLLGR